MEKWFSRSVLHSVSCHGARALLVGMLGLLPPAADAAAVPAGAAAKRACEMAVSNGMATCFGTVSNRLRDCYLKTGQACTPTDVPITRAVAALGNRVLNTCKSPITVQALGYGPLFTPATLATRLQTECLGAAQSLAARTFGGPQASLLSGAPDPATPPCLKTAYTEAAKLLKASFKAQSACVQKAHQGKTCDLAAVSKAITSGETTAVSKIGLKCTLPLLKDLVGLDETHYSDRALEQARCMTATVHADVGPLTLDCGPRAALPVPPLGQWTQVVLDNATWGTQCGDGSNYAFWLRLAPAGSPANLALVDLQGGGVCIFESDCLNVKNTDPGLFSALDDYLPSGPSMGYLSYSVAANPLANRTMIALPYCTQDVHIGGGVDSVFTSLTVHRYGAVNVRAALRYLRDVVWAQLDQTTAEGYRPDLMQVIFGGESAGGFGVQYNYHYLLDDLRWAHTTAVPDSALALDNGGIGVRTLGAILGQDPPNGWATRPFQPPYCFSGDCAVGPVIQAATAVRLKAVPEQQVLNVSNQVDDIQRSTTFFSDMKSWTNAARQAYCANQHLNGIRYWMPADPTPIHVVLTNPSRYDGTTLTSEGVSVRDWLAAAISAPDAVTDLVEEGTLASTLGVNPFTCPVGP